MNGCVQLNPVYGWKECRLQPNLCPNSCPGPLDQKASQLLGLIAQEEHSLSMPRFITFFYGIYLLLYYLDTTLPYRRNVGQASACRVKAYFCPKFRDENVQV